MFGAGSVFGLLKLLGPYFFPFEELFWIHPICRLTRQQFSLHISKQHVYSSPSSAAAAALRLDFLAVKTVLSFSHRRAAVASPRFHPPRSRFKLRRV